MSDTLPTEPPDAYHHRGSASLPSFTQGGFAGLLPQKRGPKGGHKLTPEVLAFVTAQRLATPTLNWSHLAVLVRQQFQLQVHPRSLARQLQREKKRP